MVKKSDIFEISRMSREKAVDYIRENPDDIFDIVCINAKGISDGWMARYKRNVHEM